jgi:four helix bundle protein
MVGSAIQSFTGLHAWQEAHKLVLGIYRFTKSFPREELFGLTQQIQRAGVSISSNIAEGFSRKSSREKMQFYYIALASLTEVQNQLLIARDVGFLSSKEFDETAKQTVVVSKLINGLIKSLKSRIP